MFSVKKIVAIVVLSFAICRSGYRAIDFSRIEYDGCIARNYRGI
jgi:hypothetical protein